MLSFTTLFYCLALFAATGLAGYVLEDDYFAAGFFDQFTFWDTKDPTNGFVAYQSQESSQSLGLINSTDGNIKMSVDSTNECPDGRPSVRITSKKSYNQGLVVIDIEHMPGGICGTWPAFWMVGPNWPNGGEIDILEGVNEQLANDVTLHTGPGCAVSDNGGFTGTLTNERCASSFDDNTGCQIAASNSSTETYGTGFNANEGGVYATEWTADYISVWFFPRGSCPEDALGDSPSPSSWGKPLAHFTGDCDFGTAFVDQKLVFDTTLCGDWAGNAWSSSSCAKKADTCEAYVQNNPAAFAEAYWSVNALKVYQANSVSAPSISTYIATSTSVQYVTQPESSNVAQTTMPTAYPTTLAISTKPNGYIPLPESTSRMADASPSETGTSYAPVSDGSVGYGSGTVAAPPSYTTGSRGWFSSPDGAMGYSGGHGHDSRDLDIETRDRHAGHLRAHKRHGKRRL